MIRSTSTSYSHGTWALEQVPLWYWGGPAWRRGQTGTRTCHPKRGAISRNVLAGTALATAVSFLAACWFNPAPRRFAEASFTVSSAGLVAVSLASLSVATYPVVSGSADSTVESGTGSFPEIAAVVVLLSRQVTLSRFGGTYGP